MNELNIWIIFETLQWIGSIWTLKCEGFNKFILFGYWLLDLKPKLLISNEIEFRFEIIHCDYSNQDWNLPARIPIRFGFYNKINNEIVRLHFIFVVKGSNAVIMKIDCFQFHLLMMNRAEKNLENFILFFDTTAIAWTIIGALIQTEKMKFIRQCISIIRTKAYFDVINRCLNNFCYSRFIEL